MIRLDGKASVPVRQHARLGFGLQALCFDRTICFKEKERTHMPSYQHTQIIGILNRLDMLPSEKRDRAEWLRAKAHVEFLIDDAMSDEVILCAFTHHGAALRAETYIHAEIVDKEEVTALDHSGLKHWASTPIGSRAGYSWTSGEDVVRIECFRNLRPGMPLHPRQLV